MGETATTEATDDTTAEVEGNAILGNDPAEAPEALENPEAPEKPEGQKEGETAPPDEDAVPEGDYDLGIPAEELDQEMFQEFSASAKAMGLSNKKARELVALNQKSIEKLRASQMEAWHECQRRWVNELRGDKEFGGGNFKRTTEDANRALRAYGDEKLIKELREGGLGNHAGLVRMLARIGRKMGEDRTPDGKNAPKEAERVSNWYKD